MGQRRRADLAGWPIPRREDCGYGVVVSTPDQPLGGVHHCVVAIDIVAYGVHADKVAAQRALVAVLADAATRAGQAVDEWHRQAGGDSVLAVLPAGISETRFVAAFVRGLGAALHAHTPRLRLRVAIHHGYVEWAANGWSDDTVIDVCRMRDAIQTRDAINDHPESDFVLALSDSIYREVVARRRELEPRLFWQELLHTKDRDLPAWLHVPTPGPVGVAPIAVRDRYAVVIGIGRFGDRLPSLPEATIAADRLRQALDASGYLPTSIEVNPDTIRLEAALRAAKLAARDSAAVVVSTVGHAELGGRGRVRLAPATGGVPGPVGYDLDAWLDEIEETHGAAATLLVLDATNAGALIAGRDDTTRTWVLTVTGAQSDDVGALSVALADVLGRLRAGELGLHESVAFASPDLIRVEVQRTLHNRRVSRPVPEVRFVPDGGRAPFFRNPSYVRDRERPGEGELGPFLDALGHVHSRGGVRGRQGVLDAGTTWLDRSEGADLLVVTGRAGVGKTVVLSSLVSSVHPDLAATPIPARVAAISLRGRDAAGATAAIRRQLDPDVRFGADDADALRIACLAMQPRPIVLVDGLDEAADPQVVASTLLLNLASPASARAACRVVVGGRPDERLSWLLQCAAHQVVDLDAPAERLSHQELSSYVHEAVLAEGGTRWTAAQRTLFAEHTAAALLAQRTDVGEFILADAYARHMATTWPTLRDHDARRLGDAAPRQVIDLLRLDLARDDASPLLLPMMGALMASPVPVVQDMLFLATVDVQRQLGQPRGTREEFEKALGHASFYLRRVAGNRDGRPALHLYHASLADALRESDLLPGVRR